MKIIDMFCGAGGESTGIHNALSEMELKSEFYAINHWERAIETHSMNYPEANHFCEDIYDVDPQSCRGGHIELLWASPECTHFSVARGGKPCDDQSRSSAMQIVKWCEELNIRRVIVENVPEFMTWGPLDKDNRPVKKLKGTYFFRWLNKMQRLGYLIDWRILNAADYGDPTSRRRLFIQCVKGGKRILWPEPSYAGKWRPAAEIIDWNLKGESIFYRKKPLVENTLKRIEAGIRKFWGEWAEPFLVMMKGQSKAQSLQDPLPAVTTKAYNYICQPFLSCFHGGDPNRNYSTSEPIKTLDTQNRWALIMGQQSCAAPKPVSNPCPTVATAGAISLIEPFLTQSEHGRIHSIGEPMKTITTKSRGFGLVEPFIVKYYGTAKTADVKEPLDSITTKERFGLVEGISLDILFRMLQPHELSAAQGFPGDYKFAGTKTEIIKQIGNAVPCNTAKALAKIALEGARP